MTEDEVLAAVRAVVAVWERWFSGVSRLRGEAAVALTTRLVEIRQARLSS